MTNINFIIHNLIPFVHKSQGSSLLSPAHGRAGARATLLSFYLLVPPPSEKIAGGFQQAGKKEGGLGEGIFARLLSAPKARQGWEAARSCVSRKTKPAKSVKFHLVGALGLEPRITRTPCVHVNHYTMPRLFTDCFLTTFVSKWGCYG